METQLTLNQLPQPPPKFRYLANSQPHMRMEATFVVNPKEIDAQVIERMLGFFADKESPVTVHLTEAQPERFDFQQWFQGMEAIRARTELVPVPSGIENLNELIDSVNDMDFDQP